jgi:hypothetical protein
MLITARELTSEAGEKNVGRVVEHYAVRLAIELWDSTGLDRASMERYPL